jgi:hypothetical protein
MDKSKEKTRLIRKAARLIHPVSSKVTEFRTDSDYKSATLPKIQLRVDSFSFMLPSSILIFEDDLGGILHVSGHDLRHRKLLITLKGPKIRETHESLSEMLRLDEKPWIKIRIPDVNSSLVVLRRAILNSTDQYDTYGFTQFD